MPGTIQVSVLEFKSSSSSSPPSPISLKVSIGKRDYQTWDKGDFYFPLTTLRDDLVVTLQDADENKIAHTGVQTMSIVEKGFWDDIFPFEGGGHVHMKLQFILSEEDRMRIRTMREAAMKKKKTPKTASLTESSSILVDQKVSDRSEGASSASKVHRTEVPLSEANQRESVEIHETPLPRANVQLQPLPSQEASSKMHSSGSEFPSKKNSNLSKLGDDSLDKSKRQGPLEKTPSSVRKMISTFESSRAQDARSPTKAPILKLQHEKVAKQSPFKDQNPKDDTKPSETNSKGQEDPFLMRKKQESPSFANKLSEIFCSDKDFVGNEPSLVTEKLMDPRTTTTECEGIDIGTGSILSAAHEVLNATEQVELPLEMLKPSTSETTTFSKKMHEEHSEINIEVALNERSKSVACCETENNSFGNLDTWISPNNTRNLCITTAGKEVISLLDQTEAKTHPESECSSLPENVKKGNLPHGDHKKKKDQYFFQNLRKSRSESSPDDAPSGLVGQVIKIAIIVGFGVLVLLTRQREPRKRSKTEEKDHFFTTQDFMDEQISIEETVD